MLDGGDKAFLVFSTSKTADDAAMRPQFDASIASFTTP
jgi:hypothetical protein